MSIVQALIGSIASSGTGGGGGGGTYPSPGGATYISQGTSGFSVSGTPYDPGGAVQGVASVSTGWRRVTSLGYWCNINSVANDNPGLFQTIYAETNDAYGGFGDASGADGFAMEWTGYIRASTAAAYWTIYTDSDDVAMFWIGNAAYNPTAQNAYVTSNNGTSYPTNSLLLTEGSWYPIRMRFQEWSGAERCQVYMAAEGGTAYAMFTYWNAGHVLYNGATGGYGSSNSLLLNLGETPYSGSGNWLDESPALNHAVPVGNVLPAFLSGEAGGVWQLDGSQYFNVPTLPNYKEQTATMSIWFNCAGDNTFSQTLLSKELTFKLRLVPGGAVNIMAGNGYAPWIVNSTTAVTINYGTWNHIMVTIDSGATVVYLNGQEIGTYSGTTLGTTGDFPFNIGSYSNGSDQFVGKIGHVKFLSSVFTAQNVASEYNVTVERYYPPVTLTSGTALTFNGTDNRHVIVADNLADWNLGDNWTIEWWHKMPAEATGFLSVLCQDANVPTYSGIDVFINNGSIQMFNGGRTTSESAATRGEWNHIALQNYGGTLAAYINGVAQTFSGSHSGTISPSSPLNVVIGSRTADGGANFYGQYFNGQLANIRVSSIARYSTTFTPPTTVVTDQYTKLSLDGSSGGDGMLIDELARHTITNVGAIEDTIV